MYVYMCMYTCMYVCMYVCMYAVVEMRGVGGLNPPNVQESVQILEIWKQMCKF